MTTDATIDYEALHQEALRGLVRSVLSEVAKNGLPGDHHFYISYDVRSPGVALSKRLREKYPTEMTIVLQHRFWDLLISDERFEVKLTFDGIPERLVVPFSAIKVFLDPSVRFVLHFDDASQLGDRDAADLPDLPDGRPAAPRKRVPRAKTRREPPTVPTPLSLASSEASPSERRPASGRAKSGPSLVPALAPPPTPGATTPAAANSPGANSPAAASPAGTGASKSDTDLPSEGLSAPSEGSGAQVLSLDAFRKK